jgi:hypothetical protein
MNVGAVLGYVGPGPGLTLGWAFLALLGTIGMAVLYLLFWPIRMILRKMRGAAPPVENTGQSAPPPQPADPVTKSN